MHVQIPYTEWQSYSNSINQQFLLNPDSSSINYQYDTKTSVVPNRISPVIYGSISKVFCRNFIQIRFLIFI